MIRFKTSHRISSLSYWTPDPPLMTRYLAHSRKTLKPYQISLISSLNRLVRHNKMMCWPLLITWITWWHFCSSNCTTATKSCYPTLTSRRHHVSSSCWARICSINFMNGARRQGGTRTPFVWNSWSYTSFSWVIRDTSCLFTSRFFDRFWSCWRRAKMKSSRTMSESGWWFFLINSVWCSCRTCIFWICSSAQRNSTVNKPTVAIKPTSSSSRSWYLMFTVMGPSVIKHVMLSSCVCHCHRRTPTSELTSLTIRRWVQFSSPGSVVFTRRCQTPSRFRPSTGFESQPTMSTKCQLWLCSWIRWSSAMQSFKSLIPWFATNFSTSSTRDSLCLSSDQRFSK